MITVTGKIEDATGKPLHATIDFVSKSTPQVTSPGVVITSTDSRIKSNPTDGTFSLMLAPGNYSVTIAAQGQTSAFNIAVPTGNDTKTIDELVTSPLVYPMVAPNTIWNGQTNGNITFLPTPRPAAPTSTEIVFPGGNVDPGNYSYWVSLVTATGETNVSPQLDVHLGVGAADKANRIVLPSNQSGVTAIRLWRTYNDNGHAYAGTPPDRLGLLATLPASTAFYDDWESTAQFAARVDATIVAPVVNTTAEQLLSNTGTVCAFISAQGLIVPSLLSIQNGIACKDTACRFTNGIGWEFYNFDTQLWYALVVSGNPPQLGLNEGRS